MELVDLVPVFYGMACIVSALRTDNNLSAGSKNVNDLSLSLIAPLYADYCF